MRRRGSKHIRFVHIDGVCWRYKVGRAFVELWAPDREHRTAVVEISEVVGEQESSRRANERKTYLEDRWLENNYRGYPVLPSDIVAYIRRRGEATFRGETT